MKNSVEGNRLIYWDNLKAILIFCVCLGHVLLPVLQEEIVGRAIHSLTFFVYSFHMPAFIFVSGFFSKSYVKRFKNGTVQVNKLFGFLCLYFLFKLINSVKDFFISGVFIFDILREEAAPWYMLGMVWWLLMIPVFAQIGARKAISAALLFSLFVPLWDSLSNYLVSGRTINWLPFFVAGYFFDNLLLEIIKRRKAYIIAAVIILIMAYLFIYKEIDYFYKFNTLVFASQSYASMNQRKIVCLILKILFLLGSSAMILAVMTICPTKEYWFTYIGQRTLGIYIGHCIVRDIVFKAGGYQPFLSNHFVFLAFSIILSVVLVIVFSWKPFNDFVKLPFTIKI